MRAVLVSAVLAQPFRNVPCLQVLGGSGYKADFFLFTEIVIQFVIVVWQGIREPVEPLSDVVARLIRPPHVIAVVIPIEIRLFFFLEAFEDSLLNFLKNVETYESIVLVSGLDICLFCHIPVKHPFISKFL